MRNRQSSVTMDTQYPVISNGAWVFAVGGGCAAAPRAPWPYALPVTRATVNAPLTKKTNLLILKLPLEEVLQRELHDSRIQRIADLTEHIAGVDRIDTAHRTAAACSGGT